MSRASHHIEEHTGELEIHLVAPSLAELFAEAGRALGEAMSGGTLPLAEPGRQESVALEAADRDALLVDWLNELVYRAETGKKIFADFRIDQIGERQLSATLGSAPAPELRSMVKAATFHGLKIVEGPQGFSAKVIFDI